MAPAGALKRTGVGAEAAPRNLILLGRALAPDVVEWELERGGKTEPVKALCRSWSWHQPPTEGLMLSPYQPPTGG
jgi:hypothetical protein